eukprot:364980-Chlamydomonas_euryale.AAC.9
MLVTNPPAVAAADAGGRRAAVAHTASRAWGPRLWRPRERLPEVAGGGARHLGHPYRRRLEV